MKKILLFVFLTLFMGITAQAQKTEVRGIVSDESGPLPGVSVQEKGGGIGTVTDMNGNYTISAAKGATLVFSYVGYETVERKVAGSATINIVMRENSHQLDELVVVGYGTMRKSDVATSVATVNTDEMKIYPSGNVGDMLRGRVAGVNVSSTSGRPGSAPSITIRGNRSISASNSPLYVIDGSVSDADEFATLSADNIESIEILKDAASQAIYGARASDGVILVTTKRGVAGKVKVDYNGYVGVQNLHRNFDFYSPDEFLQLRREAKANDKGLVDARDMSVDEAIGDDIMKEVWANGKFVDWEKEMFHDAWYTNHDVTVRGGSDKLKVSVGANYFDQDGIVKMNSHFAKASFRLNLDFQIAKWVKIGVNSSFAWNKQKREDGTFNEFITRTPLAQIYNEDGSYTQYINSNNDVNPLYRQMHFKREITTHSNRLNAFLILTPFKGFSYKLNTSFFNRSSEDGQAKDQYYPGGGSTATLTESDVESTLIENIFTYDVPFASKLHKLSITAAQTYDHRMSKSLGVKTNNLPVDMDWNFLSNGEVTDVPSRTYTENNLLSYLGRVSYTLMDRYIMNLALRRDGSSRFGKNHKWGTFPSVALAWRINQEPFLASQKWIYNLKLRLSYGVVGNQNGIGNYTTLGLTDMRRYEFGDQAETGYLPTKELTNPDLKWEQSKNWNIGLDFGFFNNRIMGTIEGYFTRTTDLLVYRGINSALGYTRMLDNLGETKTRGLDLSLSGDIIRSKSFVWNMGTNFSAYHDEIVKIDDQVDANGKPASQPGNSWFIGKPISVYYNYKFDGIYQYDDFDITTDAAGKTVYTLKPTYDSDGDGIPDKAIERQDAVYPGCIKVKDINGDGRITPDDRTQYKRTPDFTISLNTSVKWKNFDFYMDWYAVSGLYRSNPYLYESNYGGSLQGKLNGIKVNYWTPYNPSNDFPRPSHNSTMNYSGTLGIQDASYIRLRTVQVGYTLPAGLLNSIGISKLRFYFTASNLLTFTDFKSYSPEMSAGAYPETQQFVFGANLSF